MRPESGGHHASLPVLLPHLPCKADIALQEREIPLGWKGKAAVLEQRGEAWWYQKVSVAQMIYGPSGSPDWGEEGF